MKIAFYCPNKPLDHPDPSGDLVIARGIRSALKMRGHEFIEPARFRSRWFWKSLPGRLSALKALWAAFIGTRAFKPDIWLTYHTYYKSPDVLGPPLSRVLGIPYVVFQPMYATKRRREPGARTGFYLNRIALKAAKHAFVNNLSDLEALQRIIPKSQTTYLPPGIFPEDFEPNECEGQKIRKLHSIAPDEPLLLTAARFRLDVKFKSLVYLFKSLSGIDGKKEAFKLLVVGYGPAQEELKLAAERLLPGRVIFAGGVRREEMFRYYSAADLFVFPGIGESLGMVFLEAQACGLPVVALKTGGIPQVVRSQNPDPTAILVPSDNGEAMAEAVELLLNDEPLRRRMGRRAREFVKAERNLHVNYRRLALVLEDIAAGTR